MNDARGMRDREHLDDLLGDPQPERRIEPAANRRAEAAALDELEHQVVGVWALDVVEDAADLRVVELRENLRLAQETRARMRAQTMLRADGLQRDAPLQRFVETAVDLAHAALAERLEQQIVGNPPGRQTRTGGQRWAVLWSRGLGTELSGAHGCRLHAC